MKRKQLEQCAWEQTPASQRRDKVELTTMRGTTTKKLTGNSREIIVFDPSGTTPGSMEPFVPLWSLYNDELQQRCLFGRIPKLRAPYHRTRPDYTSSVEGDEPPTTSGARMKRSPSPSSPTAHHKNQIRMALDLYKRRGEWDGTSVQEARQVLARAGYAWEPWVREEVLRYAKIQQPVSGARKKKSPAQLDREIAQALAGQPSETGSAFYDFLLERFPGGDVPWPWVQKILKGHGVPLPLMIGLGKEDAEQYGIRQGKAADVHQLARFLGY